MRLTEDELMIACDTLREIAASIDSDCCLIHKKLVSPDGWTGIIMMRKRAAASEALEIRVACSSFTVVVPNCTRCGKC
jgi:hypothetical protein